MCGTDFTDIDSAIIETEQFIKNIHTDGIKIIEDIETQITNLFQKEIIPVLKVFLEENKVLIKMDDTLSGCKDLAVEKLQQLLDKVKISEFKSQGIEKFDIEEFSQQYENLLKELQEKEVPNKIIFKKSRLNCINPFTIPIIIMKNRITQWESYKARNNMLRSYLMIIFLCSFLRKRPD